jgi:hypothetical protein
MRDLDPFVPRIVDGVRRRGDGCESALLTRDSTPVVHELVTRNADQPRDVWDARSGTPRGCESCRQCATRVESAVA